MDIDPPVNVTSIAADQQSATDLKDFADAGYDPATNKVEGVKLADTLTTYTGNTVQTGDTFALANGASGFVATKVDTAAILVDTAEIGAAGAGLTAINLPNQTMDITGNITGNLSGSVGSVTGLTAADVGAIKTKTDSLTFTVANQVDANVQYVNDVAVTGTGAGGNEWGP